MFFQKIFENFKEKMKISDLFMKHLEDFRKIMKCSFRNIQKYI